jgi:hypothetical protein
LEFLAAHLEQHQTTELAWWRLYLAVPAGLIATVAGVLGGLWVALMVWLASPLTSALGGAGHKQVGLGPGLGIVVALAVASAVPGRRPKAPAFGLAAGLSGALIGGFGAGVANLFGLGAALWPAGGIGGALAVGAAIGPVSNIGGGAIGGVIGGLVAGLTTSVGSGLPAGLVDGLGVGLAVGLTVAMVGQRNPNNSPRWSASGLITGAALGAAIGGVSGVVVGPSFGLVTGLIVTAAAAWVTGLTDSVRHVIDAPSPAASAVRDARAFAWYSAAGALSGFVIGLMADGFDAIRANVLSAQLAALVANGLAMGLLAAPIAALVLGWTHSAWPAYTLSRLWLAAQGCLPWRLMSFLADARERGFIRQLGPVHQFRHLELQRTLAEQYRSSNGVAAAPETSTVDVAIHKGHSGHGTGRQGTDGGQRWVRH